MRQKGLTLVELMVVMSIVAILLAIVVPSYAYFSTINRLAALTNGLAGAFQTARSEAIRRALRVSVCKSKTAMSTSPGCDSGAKWSDGWVIFVDGGTKGVLDGSDQVLRVADAQSTKATVSTTNFTTYVSYLPSGQSQGPSGLGNGRISLCLMGESRSLIINNTGRIRVSQGGC
jgi:type IV fimbrial biogenesis protein FimT